MVCKRYNPLYAKVDQPISADMDQVDKPVINADEIQEESWTGGERYRQSYKVLTPSMRPRGGSLGVSLTTVPPGCVSCPFHYHQIEDEVFFILSGTGVLRYGDELFPLRPGDCISCPAGTKTAHQLANTGEEDLVYLCMGPHSPNEVGVYPDSGKIMIRGLGTVGHLQNTEYMAGEPEMPKVFDLINTHE